MLIAKQMDIRSNIKKYFDIAYDGEAVVVPRKQDRNVVIISESEYNRLSQLERLSKYAHSLSEMTSKDQEAVRPNDSLLAHNMNKLEQIKHLKKNWNGNGAPSFPSSLVKSTVELLNSLIIQPEIFPTALCTIQLEYDNSRKDHLEIELNGTNTAEVFTIKFNGEDSYDNIPATPAAINELIGAFYG